MSRQMAPRDGPLTAIRYNRPNRLNGTSWRPRPLFHVIFIPLGPYTLVALRPVPLPFPASCSSLLFPVVSTIRPSCGRSLAVHSFSLLHLSLLFSSLPHLRRHPLLIPAVRFVLTTSSILTPLRLVDRWHLRCRRQRPFLFSPLCELGTRTSGGSSVDPNARQAMIPWTRNTLDAVS